MHTTGTITLGRAVGRAVAISVGASMLSVLTMMGTKVGSSSEVAMKGGMGVSVGCAEDLVSASESEIPPMTNKSEMMAMKTPPPI